MLPLGAVLRVLQTVFVHSSLAWPALTPYANCVRSTLAHGQATSDYCEHILQAESRYHTQNPMEVLYAALGHSTSDSHASVELLTGLKAAVEDEAVKQQDLCARQAALKDQDDEEKLQGIAMMSGLQALMSAKLDLMQGHERVGLMMSNTQYTTATANVLSLG